MNRPIVQCRQCGRRMRKERTGRDHIHWLCDCGQRDKIPCVRPAAAVDPHPEEDAFARIRFQQGGDIMFEVSRNSDPRFELMSLDEISRLVSTDIPLSKVLEEIAEKIARRMRMEVCSIYLNKGGSLVLMATHGLAKEAVGKVRLAIGEGITGSAAKQRRFVAVPDAAADPRYRHFPVAREERYKAMLSHPILEEGGRVLGVINVQTVNARSYTDTEISYIAIVANLVRGCLKMRDRVRDVPADPPPDGR